MKVTFLGTGSAMPTGERAQSGLLVDADAAEPLLVDCGSGVLHALARTDVGYEEISTVLLTHHHLDHVSDLLVLLKARWLAGEGELTIAGPPGTPALVDGLLDVHDYLQGRVNLRLREVDPDGFELAGYDVATAAMTHSMPGYAYRFQVAATPEDAPAFTFSGDTEASEAVAALAAESAVLAHDCSFPDEVDVDNHPTPTQLGKVLSGHDIGRVYLTHLYPHTDGKNEEMVESVQKHFDGDVRVAHDGLTVSVEGSVG